VAVNGYVEVRSAAGGNRVELVGDRLTIGRSPHNDVVIADSETSRLHAVIDHLGGTWCIRDVSSRNGTYINGRRVTQQTPLTAGDEIRVGRTRIVVHTGDRAVDIEATVAQHRSPRLTHRERDVPVALFLPVFRSDTVTEPATLEEIASSLLVTEAAVRHHLGNLYEKFGIDGSGEQRRTRLANEALRRGAITLADVRGVHAEHARVARRAG
jgi:pSer/pThr/pTyr-binding forkhead associated (FHA) protein